MSRIVKREERTGAETFVRTVYAYIGGFMSAFFGALIIWPVWNWLVAEVTHLPNLNYWQVLGCLIVLRMVWPMQTTHHVMREWMEKEEASK